MNALLSAVWAMVDGLDLSREIGMASSSGWLLDAAQRGSFSLPGLLSAGFKAAAEYFPRQTEITPEVFSDLPLPVVLAFSALWMGLVTTVTGGVGESMALGKVLPKTMSPICNIIVSFIGLTVLM